MELHLRAEEDINDVDLDDGVEERVSTMANQSKWESGPIWDLITAVQIVKLLEKRTPL